MKKIIINSDNRRFNISSIVVGYLEENKEEVLEFEIPEKYSEYGKKACFSANGQTFAKTFDDVISNKLTITRDISQFKELDMTIAFFKIEDEDEIIARTSILHILIENAIVCDDDVKPDEPKIIVLDNLIDEVTKLDVLVTKNEEKREEYYQEIQEKVDNGDFNGATFKPSVDSEGNLSFTNDKGLDNPKTVNIRGPKGDIGEKGNSGNDGISVSSIIQTTTSSESGGTNIITATLSDGTTSNFNIMNGAKGDRGEKGDTGQDGYTPIKGTDYWTEDDKEEMKNDILNHFPSNLKGKKITVIGDSLSAGSTIETNWVIELGKNTGATVVNLAQDGATIAYRDNDNGNNFVSKMRYVPTDSDYVVIMGGGNDMFQGIGVGNRKEVNNTHLVSGAVFQIIAYLQTNLPNAKIMFITEPPIGSELHELYTPYLNIIMEMCAYTHIPCFNMTNNFGLNPAIPEVREIYWQEDYVHLTVEGQKYMSSKIQKFLETEVVNNNENARSVNGYKLVVLTQSEYDALTTKDSNTLYVVNG